jgi:hypothetical protein
MMDFERLLQLLAVLTTIGGGATVLYVGVKYALARIRRIEREGDAGQVAAGAEAAARFDRLEQEVAELQDRVDFAERLLARASEPERIDAGKDRR